MPQINLKEKEANGKDKAQNEEQNQAQASETKKTSRKDSEDVKKTVDFLKSKGEEGATAIEIAVHLGKLDSDPDPKDPETKSVARATRVIARAAVDKHGGKRDVRKGKNKLYQILG